jgi:hypothetical protein
VFQAIQEISVFQEIFTLQELITTQELLSTLYLADCNISLPLAKLKVLESFWFGFIFKLTFFHSRAKALEKSHDKSRFF